MSMQDYVSTLQQLNYSTYIYLCTLAGQYTTMNNAINVCVCVHVCDIHNYSPMSMIMFSLCSFFLLVVAEVHHVVGELVVRVAASMAVGIAIVFVIPAYKLISHFHSKHLLTVSTVTKKIKWS